ncbi:MAG: hypothetical protein H7A23_14810 [Leptospiraceae bacterium]|nr:hypothetical protein [Leptospiraceae bacterium]MCP5495821.1 hypothetical protein [Leptospiraceae bacterium]
MLKLLAIFLIIYIIYKFISSVFSRIIFVQNQGSRNTRFGYEQNQEKDISDKARVIDDEK